jgi:hypothetical protein
VCLDECVDFVCWSACVCDVVCLCVLSVCVCCVSVCVCMYVFVCVCLFFAFRCVVERVLLDFPSSFPYSYSSLSSILCFPSLSSPLSPITTYHSYHICFSFSWTVGCTLWQCSLLLIAVRTQYSTVQHTTVKRNVAT